MADVLFDIGLLFTILALVGLVGVLIFLAMTALKLKTSVMDNAGRIYKRPLAAGKNLAVTVKGIAQQETVRGKHIGASARNRRPCRKRCRAAYQRCRTVSPPGRP